MRRVAYIAGLLWLLVSPVRGQNLVPGQVGFAEIAGLMAEDPRPLAVFIHTSWCRYCRNMEHTTFRDEEVTSLLEERYYFVSLDAESEEAIEFRGHRFSFHPEAGVHSLAEALGTVDGRLSFPAFVILNPSYEIVFQYNAFLGAKAMRAVLREAINGVQP